MARLSLGARRAGVASMSHQRTSNSESAPALETTSSGSDLAVAASRKSRKRTKRMRPTQRYAMLVDLAPDATVVIDAAGRIRLVNRQTEALFGYTRDELLGQPVERLIPERFHKIHPQHRASYVAHPYTRPMGAGLPLFGRRKDDSEFPVEISLAPVTQDDETLVIASIRDVSELQRVQAANEELRRLQALTDTALSSLDLDDLLPALLDRVREVMGIDNVTLLLPDATGETLVVRASRGLDEEIANQMRIPLGTGFAGTIAATQQPLIVNDVATYPVFSRFLREALASAVGVPLLIGGRMLGVLHVGTARPHRFDVADVALLQHAADRVARAIERAQSFAAEQAARRVAETALAARETSDRRFRRLLEADLMGIVVGDAHQVTEANDTFLRLAGYSRADLEARRVQWDTMIPAEYKSQHQRAVAELLARGAVTPYENEVMRSDGRRVPLLVGALLLAREPLQWVCFVLDRSEQQALAREREEARAGELAVREVNRHLDEFFRTAAHDLRNPVAVARGHAEFAVRLGERLADQAQGSPLAELVAQLMESAQETHTSLDRLAHLVNQLFDVARARTGIMELNLAPLDPAALVREQVVAQRVATPGRTIELELPADGDSVAVMADGDRLRQVLGNYLTNALKYSADDQPVVVRLEVVEGLAVVSVQDQGPGLTWEEQSRVWELFYRASGVEVQSAAGGTGSLGLGLHVCKRLIELHPGGRVGVESAEGQGATFWFRLPLAG